MRITFFLSSTFLWASSALASTTPATKTSQGFDILGFIVPLLFFFVVMYFFMIRPQQKKDQHHKSLVAALKRGDRVLTSGGLIVSVTRVINEHELEIEISEGVKGRLMKAMVMQVLAKTAPSSVDESEPHETTPAKKNTKGTVRPFKPKK